MYDNNFRFTVEFTRRSSPEGEFVNERRSGSHQSTEHGPMPADIVPAFIEERQTIWQKLADDQMSRFFNNLGAFGNAEMNWPPAI